MSTLGMVLVLLTISLAATALVARFFMFVGPEIVHAIERSQTRKHGEPGGA